MSNNFQKSESVTTPAKPDARRRCLDIEYKRRHGCVDQVDVILIALSTFFCGIGLGIVFVMG